MHPPHMVCSRVNYLKCIFQSRQLFLGMDVIGSFMTRDVFVGAMQ